MPKARDIVGGIATKINEVVDEPVNRGDHTPEDLGRGYVSVAEAEAAKAAVKTKEDTIRNLARERIKARDAADQASAVKAAAKKMVEDAERRKKETDEPKVFRNEDL